MNETFEEIREMLQDVLLVKDLDSSLQEKLMKNMKIARYSTGEIIFKDREPGDKIYIVKSGQVAIKKSIDWAKGKEFIIDYCDPGDFFGEMAVIEETTRSARAEATDESELFVIDGLVFLDLMHEHPDTFTKLLFSMIKILSNRLRINQMKLITLYEIGNILSGIMPTEEIASQILDTLLISLEMENGALLIYNPFNELMEFGALRGISPVNPDMRGVRLMGVLKQCMDKGQCAMLDDNFIDDNLRAMLGAGARHPWILMAPMRVEHEPIGFVILVKKEDFAPFNKDEVLLVTSIAKLISLEIMHARVREETTAREKFKRVYFKDVI